MSSSSPAESAVPGASGAAAPPAQPYVAPSAVEISPAPAASAVVPASSDGLVALVPSESSRVASVPTAAAVPTKPPGAPRAPIFSAEAWAPLKVELFRSLYIATSIAQIGTWVREAGGPILMERLTAGRHDSPAMVGYVLLFSNLPICLFSVFAGALADVLDRRRLLIVTQVWMMVFSALLGTLTIAGVVSPGLLLLLTFIVATGTAAAGPALQALLPELVPKKDLPLAINLNSVALNVARALGPALLIIVVSIIPGRTGIGASFFLTAASFVWAIYMLVTWKREPQRMAVKGERMWDAIRAGFQYTIHSPANRAILIRVAAFIVPAVVMWAQVPIIATGLLHVERAAVPRISAVLFAFMGLGAILGVLVMPGLQKRFRIDPVVNVCTALFAAGLIVLSFMHHLWQAWIVMTFLGVNWVIIPTNFNTATQTSVPLWVKGRAISFYLTVLFGSFTISALLWGRVTTATSIHTSLMAGGISMAALLVLARWFPLTLNQGLDLSAAQAGASAKPLLPDIVPPADPNAAPMPAAAEASSSTPIVSAPLTGPSMNGPVEVALRYDVHPTKVEQFLKIMPRVGQQRRRNGAVAWRLEGGASASTSAVAYEEIFRFRSGAELKRQAARMTTADVTLLQQVQVFHAGPEAQSARARVLVGDEADAYAPLKPWLGAQISAGFDHLFDQIAATFDRFAAMHDRERKSRTPVYREITIQIPGDGGHAD